MNIIIAVSAASEEERQYLQSLLMSNHVSGQIVAKIIPENDSTQVLGRDAIIHEAKKKAQTALQYTPPAKYSIGVQRGLEMAPAGTFVVCCAAVRFASGREYVGWSEPRIVPETVAVAVGNGGSFLQVMQAYRQHWHISDPLSLVDIEELLTCRQGTAEALQVALAEMET